MGLFGHYPPPIAQNFSVTPPPTLYVSLHTWYTTQWPQLLPVRPENHCLWTQRSHCVDSPSHVSIRSSWSSWAAATPHIQMVPIADWALVSLNQTRPRWLLTPLPVQQIGLESKDWKGINLHVTREQSQDIQASMLHTCIGAITYNHNTPPGRRHSLTD